MPTLDPDLVTLLSLTTGLGAALLWLMARTKAVDVRDTRRRCPGCGVRTTRAGDCACSL